MANLDSVVDACATYAETEHAVRRLLQGGYDEKRLSVVGKTRYGKGEVMGCYDTGDGMRPLGDAGASWGPLWELLPGSAFFVIAGIGPVLVAGALVAVIAGAPEQAAVIGGLSALGAGLQSLGVPRDKVVAHEAALKQDKLLVIAHGSAEEVERARAVLETALSQRFISNMQFQVFPLSARN